MEYDRIALDYSSLEPYIDDKTLDLHYNKHYKNYTDNLNKYLKDSNFDYSYTPEYLAKNIDIIPLPNRDEIFYNLGGYLNHSLYFNNLTNISTSIPKELNTAIEKSFGSFDEFKKEFISLANDLKGSGYTFLVLDNNGNLKIINTSNQDTPYYYGYIPLMTIDVWEHSYYLKYYNDRDTYLNSIFDIIDWNMVYDLYLENKNR